VKLAGKQYVNVVIKIYTLFCIYLLKGCNVPVLEDRHDGNNDSPHELGKDVASRAAVNIYFVFAYGASTICLEFFWLCQ